MEWFDDDFFKTLKEMGVIQVEKVPDEINRLIKERDKWKQLFERERVRNEYLTEALSILTKYLG